MGRIHYETIGLAQAVRAQYIVIVEPSTGRQRYEVDVEGTNPYVFSATSYTVKKVIKGPQTLAGTTVQITPPHLSQTIELYRKYNVERISKSPIYEKYLPSFSEIPQTDSSIFFLSNSPLQGDNFYQMAFEKSRDGVEAEADIVSAMAQDKTVHGTSFSSKKFVPRLAKDQN